MERLRKEGVAARDASVEAQMAKEEAAEGSDDVAGAKDVETGATKGAAPENDSPAKPNLFHLTLRGSQTQVFAVAVKPTILISGLLRQYCKKFSIDAARMGRMWLEFDGEKLEAKKRLDQYADEIENEETIDVREGKGQ